MSVSMRRLLIIGGAIFCMILVFGMVLLSISVVASASGLNSIKKWQLEAATRQFTLAQRLIQPLSNFLPENSPFQIYHQAVLLGADSASLGKAIATQSGQPFTSWSLQPLLPSLLRFNQDAQRFSDLFTNSPQLLTLLSHDTQELLKLQQSSASPFFTLLSSLASGRHRYVFMFLNSNEIRPTGGFAGSYALLDLDQGRIKELQVEDIYDADGQFKGFLAPPPGVKEYLSGGRGWRLPDANWWIDYPSSAQQQLKLLALGNRTNVEGVVSLNVDLLRRILAVTGPVYLPNQNQQLTVDTLTDILENRPGQFFPGNRQKQQIISSALTQLLLSLEQLPLTKQLAIVSSINEAAAAKEIQAYSVQPEIQALFEALGVTGSWPVNQPALGLVEANVGINKINQSVSRSVSLQSPFATNQTNDLELAITWKNTAPPTASNSSYINYHRLVMPSDWNVIDLQLNDQPIPTRITTEQTYSQQPVKEVGFIIPVFAQSSAELKARLRIPSNQSSFVLVKQAGIPPTPLLITNPSDQVDAKVWDRDLTITF